MLLSFSFSPCPNDTFMFEPMVSKKVISENLKFEFHLHDVEKLNQYAFLEKYHVTKLSYNAFTKLSDRYQLLNSGSALGNNCGPILVSKKNFELEDIQNLKIAIPGKNTTAFLLLQFAFPFLNHVSEMVFSEIEESVLTGDCDAGLLIHENRFTYEKKGLVKLIDLGSFWEEKTGYPIPLGGIAVKRSLPENVKMDIDKLLFKSISYAFSHPKSGLDYIRKHAQEMDDDVMFSHIKLYVNQYSKDLGNKGKSAVWQMFEFATNRKLDKEAKNVLFVPKQ